MRHTLRNESHRVRLGRKLERSRLLKEVAKVFEGENAIKEFLSVPYVERMSFEDLRRHSAIGTAFEPMATALGFRVEPTMGQVMERLGLTKTDVDLVMYHWAMPNRTVTGQEMVGHLRYFARLSLLDRVRVLISRMAEKDFGQTVEQIETRKQ